jgi:galactonate dehydratase
VEKSVSRVASIRQELGYDLDVALDFHGRVHKGMAKVLAKELEPYHPMFIEEPVQPQNNEALKEIASSTTIPIATGERMFSRWEFKNLFESGYVAIVQPDLSHAGGISECKKIATMAEAYDVALAPHCPLGPIALASCIQVDCCSPNALIQEQSLGIHYNEGNELLHYLKDDSLLQYENGYVDVPKGAGLGITVDEEAVRDAADKGHDWKNPVWHNEDGTIAEW